MAGRNPAAPKPITPPRFPPRPTPNKPPRRGFLGALAALAAAPVVAATASAANPDAELIRSCALAIDAQRECEASYCYPLTATFEEALPYEEQADRFADLAHRHGWAAVRMPAKTVEGVAAKARAAMALAPTRRDGTFYTDGTGEDLAWNALQDLLRILKARR